MIKWKPSFADRILMKLFDYQIISETNCEDYIATGNEDSGDAYLVRYFIWNDNQGPVKKPHIYLHHIIKSDPDREHHDHPWDFYSLILKGGYTEQTPVPITPEMSRSRQRFIKDYNVCNKKWYGPGSFLIRPAAWTHRLFLEEGKTCWTLVYTKKKSRDWGFHTKKGWLYWRKFMNHKCGPTGTEQPLTDSDYVKN